MGDFANSGFDVAGNEAKRLHDAYHIRVETAGIDAVRRNAAGTLKVGSKALHIGAYDGGNRCSQSNDTRGAQIMGGGAELIDNALVDAENRIVHAQVCA